MNRFGVNVAFVIQKSTSQSNVGKFILFQIERQSSNDIHLIKIKIEVFILGIDKDRKTFFELIMIKNYYQRQQIWLKLVLKANY